MSEHPMPPTNSPDHDAQWEAAVKRMAADMVYPPTPNIAARVRQRLERPHPSAHLRFAQAAAVMLLLLAALMAVPQVRAEVVRFLQIGVIRIFFGEPTATPTSTSAPSSSTRPTHTPRPITLQSVLELPGETTLAAAREAAPYEIVLPTYPADLGEPDRVFVLESEGVVVVLVWLSPEDPTTPMLSLFSFSPNNDVWKTGVRNSREIKIDGAHALWTEAPHRLEFETREGRMYRMIDDTVLIWFRYPITYRLEGAESMEEAQKIVESLVSDQ